MRSGFRHQRSMWTGQIVHGVPIVHEVHIVHETATLSPGRAPHEGQSRPVFLQQNLQERYGMTFPEHANHEKTKAHVLRAGHNRADPCSDRLHCVGTAAAALIQLNSYYFAGSSGRPKGLSASRITFSSPTATMVMRDAGKYFCAAASTS